MDDHGIYLFTYDYSRFLKPFHNPINLFFFIITCYLVIRNGLELIIINKEDKGREDANENRKVFIA